MDLNEIVKIQNEFDKSHGFSNEFSREALTGIALALMGECGELANLIKKYNRAEQFGGKNSLADKDRDYLEEAREELADILVYLMKFSMILGADLEQEYLKKIEKNKIKLKDFEK